jgi:hypothetical protein
MCVWLDCSREGERGLISEIAKERNERSLGRDMAALRDVKGTSGEAGLEPAAGE